MARKFAERVNLGDKDSPIPADLYHDSEVGKVVSYALRSYKILHALKKGPEIDVEKGIETYSAKLPQFDEESRMNAGFIHPSPHKEGVYWIVMDERLNDDERLGVAFHEISHLAGGYHENEKQTQKQAIDSLTNLARNYDKLDSPKVSEILKRDTGINYDISEMEKTELGRALRYLIDRGHHFGIDDIELNNLGIRKSKGKNLEGLLGIISLFLGIYLLLPHANITGNVINNGNYFTKDIFSTLFGFFLLFSSITIFSYKKIIFKRLK